MTTLEWVEKLADEGQEFCLGVLVAKSGSTPQMPGAKGLFLPDGRVIGTLGGGCLEMEARRLALLSLRDGLCRYQEFQLDSDFGWDDGLICGGRVQVFLHPVVDSFADAVRAANSARASGTSGALVFGLAGPGLGSVRFYASTGPPVEACFETCVETGRPALARDGDAAWFVDPILPPERLVIYGAGHIATALCALAGQCDFSVTVIDDRSSYANAERLPTADEILVENPEDAAARLPMDERTYVCVVTRGHRNDARVLRHIVAKPAAYIGMIGSRRKVAVLREQFLEESICTEAQFDRVKSPMGLDIGSETVVEIAVSILAELLKVRAERRGPVLARCGQKPLKV
jgi:xanthine dehydrogenase accessory factor